ncbi:MAG: hypothetical protein MHPSP_001064, partial [Paramarteilia canceri]
KRCIADQYFKWARNEGDMKLSQKYPLKKFKVILEQKQHYYPLFNDYSLPMFLLSASTVKMEDMDNDLENALKVLKIKDDELLIVAGSDSFLISIISFFAEHDRVDEIFKNGLGFVPLQFNSQFSNATECGYKLYSVKNRLFQVLESSKHILEGKFSNYSLKKVSLDTNKTMYTPFPVLKGKEARVNQIINETNFLKPCRSRWKIFIDNVKDYFDENDTKDCIIQIGNTFVENDPKIRILDSDIKINIYC